MNLLRAQPEKLYKITSINGDGKLRRRLIEIGFTTGSEIYVSAAAPFGGAVLVSVRGFSVAVRGAAAEAVCVE